MQWYVPDTLLSDKINLTSDKRQDRSEEAGF